MKEQYNTPEYNTPECKIIELEIEGPIADSGSTETFSLDEGAWD